MATETVENYIEATYVLRRESPSGKAGVVRLAQEVGVTKGNGDKHDQAACEVGLGRCP
ncbi:MAG: hypothetical protein WCO86_16635 [Planctomycetota bacterium]